MTDLLTTALDAAHDQTLAELKVALVRFRKVYGQDVPLGALVCVNLNNPSEWRLLVTTPAGHEHTLLKRPTKTAAELALEIWNTEVRDDDYVPVPASVV